MSQVKCIDVPPDVDWFTPGKIYKGYLDCNGQAFHTRDDHGEETFIWLDQSSHGSFRQINPHQGS